MLIPMDMRTMRRLLSLLAVLLFLLYVAVVAISAFQDYRATVHGAENASRRLSAALSEHASRALGEADGLLLSAMEDIEASVQATGSADASALAHQLQPYSNMLPQLVELVVLDGGGRVLASGLSGAFRPPLERADRDYFRYHAEGGRGLFLSRPFKNVQGRWVFMISRALSAADGSLRMVVAGAIAVDYFENFYRQLILGGKGHLLLVRRDGRVLVESPLTERALGIDISAAPLFSLMRESATGMYHTESAVVGQQLGIDMAGVVGYAESDAYPFVAVSFLARSDILQSWRDRAANSLALATLSILLTLILLASLRRYLNALQRTQAELENNNKTLARSEHRYQELVNDIDGVVWECRYPSLEFSYVSPNAARITGHPPADWLRGAQFWEESLGTPRQHVIDAVEAATRNGASAVPPLEHHTLRPDGKHIWLLNNMTLRGGVGAEPMLRGVMVDNSERKRAYEERELAAKVFDSSLHAVMILTREGIILRANKAMSTLIGYPDEEIIGLDTAAIESDFHDPAFARSVRAALRNTGKWQGEVKLRAKNGNPLVLMQSMALMGDADGNSQNVIVICNDITGQRQSEGKLYQMAHFDRLTHLPNRQTFADRTEHALKIAARMKSQLAVLSLDIDHFKTVNDSLGHRIGDKVLVEVAKRIGECLRPVDTVARTGGDEFLVLLEEVESSTEGIEQIADKLCDRISQPIRLDGSELYLGLSIGISVFPQDGADADTLIRNADAAMYRAKAAGRSCHRFFDESMARLAARRLELQTALRRAIDRGELRLYYQPQHSLRSGEIVGVEALTRWDRPGVGIIAPQEFIPLTEESSLIVTIGNWAMKEACTQSAAWLRDHGWRLRVGVNITARQVQQTGFVEQVRATLAETGLPPELLELEITEGSILENIEESRFKLEQVKALGVSVAIDDFGIGYSSLSYLKQLPIDRLKIDKSFVRDTPADPDDSAIVRTIIAMSATLGLSVIAEGVESQEQADFLRAEACDEIQGYLISQPQPATALATLLDRHARRQASVLS